MAKPDEKPTESPTDGGRNKTGLYVIGALALAAVVAVVVFLRDDAPRDPNAPQEDPELAALIDAGPLEDIVLGDPDAPNVIVEYASMTCPHCAYFYENVFPDVKKKYIDTGEARFVFREFPLDQLAAEASMLARCAGNDRFHPMIEGLFETQKTWALQGEEGKEKLLLIAKQAGFSEESFKKCVTNKELFDKLVAARKKANEEFGVNSTPTFFVNGKRLPGVGIEHFDAAIAGSADTKPNG